MAWDENLTNLNRVLADLYPLPEDSFRIVDEAGIPRVQIAFNPKALNNWHAILDEARKREKVTDIVRAARKDFPENPYLERAEQGRLTPARSPVIEDEDLAWKTQETPETLEKIMGKQSTLLPISFLEVGVQRALSVARIKRSDGLLGTGFLTNDSLLVTNNHVLENERIAKSAIAQFGYQQSATGLDMQSTDLELDPDSGFATSEGDDWSLVRVEGDPNAKWGALELQEGGTKQFDRVNIIQHPGGGPKQIALYHNVVAYADDKRIQYLTDTLPGSSGSPVFDSDWNLVALHHSGGWIKEPGTKSQVYRNEGINIKLVREGLEAAGL